MLLLPNFREVIKCSNANCLTVFPENGLMPSGVAHLRTSRCTAFITEFPSIVFHLKGTLQGRNKEFLASFLLLLRYIYRWQKIFNCYGFYVYVK